MFIPFFVYGFWSLLVMNYKNIKSLRNLCLHSARQDGQDGKKWKENHAIKVTKKSNTKRQKYGMNKTWIISWAWNYFIVHVWQGLVLPSANYFWKIPRTAHRTQARTTSHYLRFVPKMTQVSLFSELSFLQTFFHQSARLSNVDIYTHSPPLNIDAFCPISYPV